MPDKVDFGEIVVASTTNSVTFPHNLGETPTNVSIIPKRPGYNLVCNGWQIYFYGAYYTSADIATAVITKDENQVTVTAPSVKFYSSTPYYYIVSA